MMISTTYSKSQKNLKIEKSKSSIPWIEKYRPGKFEDIISHNVIIESLNKFFINHTIPHMLFFGPPGSGKTSTILCFVNKVYGEYKNAMVLKLNASKERGIDTVRTIISKFINSNNRCFLPIKMRNLYKLIILDEIDSMTIEAQGMLRYMIEKHSDSTRFCLICNETDKINVALKSRCALFRFSPLSSEEMEKRLVEICDEEGVTYDDESISTIVSISHGDMRTSINTLQYVSISLKKKLDSDEIYKISGNCKRETVRSIFALLENYKKGKINLKDTFIKLSDVVDEHNITIPNLLDELTDIILDKKCKLDTLKKIKIVQEFAKIEEYDMINVDQSTVLKNIVSIFIC